jgi:predicted  nucleic acid-binding Zn-ribbon protein
MDGYFMVANMSKNNNKDPDNNKTLSTVIDARDFFSHDKRIALVEQSVTHIDSRFNWVDKRIDDLETKMDKRFEQVDKQFEYVHKRIDILEHKIDQQFERVDKKFEHQESKIDSHFRWIMGSMGGLALSGIGILVTLLLKLH